MSLYGMLKISRSMCFLLRAQGSHREMERERGGRSGFTEDGLILLAAVWMPGGPQETSEDAVLSEQDPPL